MADLASQSTLMDEEKPGPPASASWTLRKLGWLLSSKPFWLTVSMLLVGTLLHYVEPLPIQADLPFEFTRRSMNRILFMVPVVYAGFIFGPAGGFATLFAATLAMLPRALLISGSPPDSMSEVVIIAVVSSFIILWFRGQRREQEHRLDLLQRLETARQELAYQVEVIKKNERRLGAVNHVCCAAGQSLDISYLLHLVLEKATEEMGVEAAMIFLKNRSGESLSLAAYRGISEQFARAVSGLRAGEGFNGRVVQSGQPMLVENSAEDPRRSVLESTEEGILSQLIVPLRSRGETIGTLCVAAHSVRQFDSEDLDLLTAIGGQVGMTIENARLYNEVLSSEARYRDLFENATVAIFVQGLAGTITAANKECARLTGYEPEELVGSDVRRLFPAPVRAKLARVQEELLAGGAVGRYDLRMLRKDGSEATLSVTTRPVFLDGRPVGLQHIAYDITERRRMQERLDYYTRQVLNAQEEERKRIARELHDETAQSLLLILQRMDLIDYGSKEKLPDEASMQLEEVRGLVLRSLSDLRRMTRDLRPQILDDLGLVAAIEWLAEDMDGLSIRTSVRLEGSQRAIPPETQLLIFRIVQEALNNVRRHSGASEAAVVLSFLDEEVRVSVEDNGRGFTVPTNLNDLAATGKLGVIGMRERARLMGGAIEVRSEPGKGTVVTARLQLPEPSLSFV